MSLRLCVEIIETRHKNSEWQKSIIVKMDWISEYTEDEDRGYRGERAHTLAMMMEAEMQPPIYKAACKSMTSK